MSEKTAGKVGFFKSLWYWIAFPALTIISPLACQQGPNPPLEQDAITQVPPAVSPPYRTPDYDTTQWTEILHGPRGVLLDLRYADTGNFVGEKMYECGRCFLRPQAAEALLSVAGKAQRHGYRLLLLDCYRPKPVQQRLWDKVPNARYVTPPDKGSMHNRGLAVDLTFTDMWGGEMDMGSPYDSFGEESWYTFSDLPEAILQRRRLLRHLMDRAGFKAIRTEWWHFSYRAFGEKLDDWMWPCPE